MKRVLSIYKIISLRLVVLIFVATGSIGVFADKLVYGDFLFETEGGQLRLTKYYENDETVVIPDSVPYQDSNWPVSVISKEAFSNKDGIKTINIPHTVTKIEDNFVLNSSNLEEIKIEEGNLSYASKDGILYSAELKELICCPEGKAGDIMIDTSPIAISPKAFYQCRKITSITLPVSITEIGDEAFENCSSLESINIPESVTTIGARAFQSCLVLKYMTLPDSIKEIGEEAFSACISLERLEIPKDVIDFDGSAVNGCTSLKSIILPEYFRNNLINGFLGCSSLEEFVVPSTVKRIGNLSFCGCNSLKKIEIPESVTSIHPCTFAFCPLLEIEIDDNNPKYRSTGKMIIEKRTNYLTRYPNATEDVEIPEGIEGIKEMAFYNCEIDMLRLPSSIKFIDYYAFLEMVIRTEHNGNSYGPKKILCPVETPPEVQRMFSVAFNPEVDNFWTVNVYVPGSAVNTYRNTFPWSYYNIYPIPGTEEESGVDLVSASDAEIFEVYNLNGVMVLKTGNKEDLQTLPRGIYIINGQKVVM